MPVQCVGQEPGSTSLRLQTDKVGLWTMSGTAGGRICRLYPGTLRPTICAVALDLREIHQIGPDTHERLVPSSACPPLAALGVAMCGISEARPGFRFVRPRWNQAQVLACLAGSGQVLVDGYFQTCAPGTAYLCPPGILHAYHCPPAGVWTLVWTIFAPGRGPNCGNAPTLVAGEASDLHDAVRGLHREVLGAAEMPALTAWAGLVDVLARRNAAVAKHHRLDAIWREVADHPERPWSLALLAHEAGLGPELLRRLCQQHFKLAPMAQVTRLRMRQAGLLLASRHLPVTAVATAVGYTNPYAFSTAFRRYSGIPPSRWGDADAAPR